MNTKDIYINDTSFKKLIQNDNYFKQIFKKTEKVVSVVFYILQNTDPDKKSETQISNLASKAHFVHENALRTLEVKLSSSKEVLEQFAQALVGLDSTLRIAATSNIITSEVLTVVVNEIDVILRGLNTYITDNTGSEGMFFAQSVTTSSSPTRSASQSVTSLGNRTTSGAKVAPGASGGNGRRERIKTILEAKGEATIKDISEIITDCSEKTIQRELNAMIGENQVKRQGERRWSKYSIF